MIPMAPQTQQLLSNLQKICHANHSKNDSNLNEVFCIF